MQRADRLKNFRLMWAMLAVAALSCFGSIGSAQNATALPGVSVTVNWSAPTGFSSNDMSFGVNTQLTDPHVVVRRPSSEDDRAKKEPAIGSLLLIHSVKKTADQVELNLDGWPEMPKKVTVKTITDKGLATTTIPFSRHLVLTLPATSVTALIFEAGDDKD